MHHLSRLPIASRRYRLRSLPSDGPFASHAFDDGFRGSERRASASESGRARDWRDVECIIVGREVAPKPGARPAGLGLIRSRRATPEGPWKQKSKNCPYEVPVSLSLDGSLRCDSMYSETIKLCSLAPRRRVQRVLAT